MWGAEVTVSSPVIRCMRCYGRVEYDDQPHLDLRGYPCREPNLVLFATCLVIVIVGFAYLLGLKLAGAS